MTRPAAARVRLMPGAERHPEASGLAALMSTFILVDTDPDVVVADAAQADWLARLADLPGLDHAVVYLLSGELARAAELHALRDLAGGTRGGPLVHAPALAGELWHRFEDMAGQAPYELLELQSTWAAADRAGRPGCLHWQVAMMSALAGPASARALCSSADAITWLAQPQQGSPGVATAARSRTAAHEITVATPAARLRYVVGVPHLAAPARLVISTAAGERHLVGYASATLSAWRSLSAVLAGSGTAPYSFEQLVRDVREAASLRAALRSL